MSAALRAAASHPPPLALYFFHSASLMACQVSSSLAASGPLASWTAVGRAWALSLTRTGDVCVGRERERERVRVGLVRGRGRAGGMVVGGLSQIHAPARRTLHGGCRILALK